MLSQLPPSPISQNIFSSNPNLSLSDYLNTYNENIGVSPFAVDINLENWASSKIEY